VSPLVTSQRPKSLYESKTGPSVDFGCRDASIDSGAFSEG
jgi:hypothetical protein